MKRRSEFQSLSEVGRIPAGRAAARGTLARLRVFNAWNRALQGRLASATRPIHFENGTLRIEIDDVKWLPELRRHESEILDRLREALAGDEVRRLDFRS